MTLTADRRYPAMQLLFRLIFCLLAGTYFYAMSDKPLSIPFGVFSLILLIACAFYTYIWFYVSRNGYHATLIYSAIIADILIVFLAITNDPYDPSPTMVLMLIAILVNGVLHGVQRLLNTALIALVAVGMALLLRDKLLGVPVSTGFYFQLLFSSFCIAFFYSLLKHNEKLLAETDDTAFIDDRTGLANQKGLLQISGYLLALRARTQFPLTLVVMECHSSDNINPKQQEELDISLGQLISNRVRRSDLVAHYGDKQFVFLLPDTTIEPAQKVIETLHEQFHQLESATGNWAITSGLLDVPQETIALDRLIQHVDTTLIRAKQRDNSPEIIHAPAL